MLLLVLAGGEPVNNTSYKITLSFTPIFKMISAHGNVMVIVSKQIKIHIIALPSGHELRILDAHRTVNGAFSPNGKWLATATRDSNMVVYSTTDSTTKKWKLKDYPWTMSFPLENTLLVNHTLWDVNKARLITTLKTDFGEVNAIALNADGTQAATGGGDTRVRLYDLGSGDQSSREWKFTNQYNGLKLEVLGLAFTPDGSEIAVGGLDGHITLLDAATGKVLKTIQTGMTGISSIEPVGKSHWMLVRYINARTDKQKGYRLVNISTGKSRPFCDTNTIVRISGGKIWSYSFKDDTMTATPKAVPQE